ncbi:MAG: ribosome maturation factor RimM [Acholeplasmatales bacterium]|nr:ribosome maturation factor RimM [Acholeplasmatales bacterium]
MKYYQVARILNTHGLKGELKLQVITDFDRFYEGSKLYIGYKDEYIPVTVKYSKDYKQGILVVLKDLEDINLVEKYKNSFLYISEEDRGEAPEGVYFFSDLIGKEVYNQNDELKGVVTEMEENGNGYNLVIKKENDKKNYRVPFVQNVFIKEVKEDKIIINEIEGLF